MTPLPALLRRVAAWPYVRAVGIGIAGVALIAFAVWRDRGASEREGALKERVAKLQRDSAAYARQAARTDTQYITDTIHLTRAVTRYETLRDSVLIHRTDTLLVERFVTASDTTIRACRVALTTCETRVAQRDSLLALSAQQRATDAALFRVQLARANPRVLPYVEALVNPFAAQTMVARGGLEIRLFGPIRLVGALQYTTAPQTFTPLVGARVTF